MESRATERRRKLRFDAKGRVVERAAAEAVVRDGLRGRADASDRAASACRAAGRERRRDRSSASRSSRLDCGGAEVGTASGFGVARLRNSRREG